MRSYFYAILSTVVYFYAPIGGLIMTVAIMTLLDTAFGLWRSYKLGREIKSRLLRIGLGNKLIPYIAIVMLVYMSDVFIINDLLSSAVSIDFMATKSIALVLIAIEVKSMDESFKEVKGYSFVNKIIRVLISLKNAKNKIKNSQ